jgi:prophage regulatory protein
MRFVLKAEVIARVGYTDQHLLRLEKAGKFPKRIQIGPGRVGWLDAEIDAWQAARVAARDAGIQQARVEPPRPQKPAE